MRTVEEYQAEFYKSQSTEYRKGWWKWALDQPNFMGLFKYCIERDEEVLAAKERALREYRESQERKTQVAGHAGEHSTPVPRRLAG